MRLQTARPGVTLALLLVALGLVGCANADPEQGGPPTFSEIVADADGYDGKIVTIDAAYYGAFEVSVIASGLTESDPPQPVEPLVWVGAAPGNECLQESEGAAWADRVEAKGTFRFDPEGGFGHLGEYEMVIEDAELVCVRAAPVSSVLLGS